MKFWKISFDSASETFSAVLSPSLGVYRMQMGQLVLEVSSGDITKETCDVIVNSSNQNFDLYAGDVSCFRPLNRSFTETSFPPDQQNKWIIKLSHRLTDWEELLEEVSKRQNKIKIIVMNKQINYMLIRLWNKNKSNIQVWLTCRWMVNCWVVVLVLPESGSLDVGFPHCLFIYLFIGVLRGFLVAVWVEAWTYLSANM